MRELLRVGPGMGSSSPGPRTSRLLSCCLILAATAPVAMARVEKRAAFEGLLNSAPQPVPDGARAADMGTAAAGSSPGQGWSLEQTWVSGVADAKLALAAASSAAMPVLVLGATCYFFVWRYLFQSVGLHTIRDTVWVRDTTGDPWRKGTVTGFEGEQPIVRPDGWDRSSSHTWNHVCRTEPEPLPADTEPEHVEPQRQPPQAPASLAKQYVELSAAMGSSNSLGTLGWDTGVSLPEKVKELDSIDHEGLSKSFARLNETVEKYERHEQQHDRSTSGLLSQARPYDAASGLSSNTLGLESFSDSQYDQKLSWERPDAEATMTAGKGGRCLAKLVCVDGDGKNYEMRDPKIVLGRQPSGRTPRPGTPAASQGPDFVVGSDKTISRKHAMITCHDLHEEEPTVFSLQCLGKNHVNVNGMLREPAGGPLDLHSGDVLTIGSVKLRFQLASDQRGSPRARPVHPGTGSGKAKFNANTSSSSSSHAAASRQVTSLAAARQVSGPVLATLRAVDDSSAFTVQREETIIGRSCANPQADCLLRSDRSISRRHAKLVVERVSGNAFETTTLHAGPPVRGELAVTEVHCDSICPARDGASNPSIQLCMGAAALTNRNRNRWHKSELQHMTNNPLFKTSFRLPVPAHPTESECTLLLELHHSDRPEGTSGQVFLGQLALDLSKEFRGDWTRELDKTWPLSDPQNRVASSIKQNKQRQPRPAYDEGLGSVHLRISFRPDEPMPTGSISARQGSRFWLDCIGQNHVIINGREVDRRYELQDQDRVMIGPVAFHLHVSAGTSPGARVNSSPAASLSAGDLHSRSLASAPSWGSEPSARQGKLSQEQFEIVCQIFDFIDTDRVETVDEKKLRSFARIHHDPSAVTNHALDGMLAELLDFGGVRLGKQKFTDWFAAMPSSRKVDEVIATFREKWSDDWASQHRGLTQQAQDIRPPELARQTDIRSAVESLVMANFSAGMSSRATEALQADQQGRISALYQAAERKLRDGIHPNMMLDWIRQFGQPLLKDSAARYPRIAEFAGSLNNFKPPTENFINAVDTVWLVDGSFRPNNPHVAKKPPPKFVVFKEYIESGEYDSNEYLLGDSSSRHSGAGADGSEDRLSPLLLLAKGHYGWEKEKCDLMLQLLDNGADPNQLGPSRFNALFYLVERAPWSRSSIDLERVAERLMSCTDLRNRDDQRRSLLNIAVERDQADAERLCNLLMPRVPEFGMSQAEKSSVLQQVEQIRRQSRSMSMGHNMGGAASSVEQTKRRQTSTRRVFEALRSGDNGNASLKQQFASMDRNGDNLLSADEFAHALRRCSNIDHVASIQLAHDVMDTHDRNGDNAIDYKEFIAAYKAQKITAKLRDKLRRYKANLHGTFDAMDTNRDGKLSKAEFRSGLEKLKLARDLSASEMDELMQAVDSDGDGHIDFNEFILMASYEDEVLDSRGATSIAPSPTSSLGVGSNSSLRLDLVDEEQSSTPRERKARAAAAATKKVIALLKEGKVTTKNLKRKFAKMDTNKDNRLSATEFARGLRELAGINYDRSHELAQQMMTAIDKNRDGYIDYKELETAWRNDKVAASVRDTVRRAGKDVRAIFQDMDGSGTGVISRSEFTTGLERLGVGNSLTRQEVDQLVAAVDLNGDGRIDIHECGKIFSAFRFIALVGEDAPDGRRSPRTTSAAKGARPSARTVPSPATRGPRSIPAPPAAPGQRGSPPSSTRSATRGPPPSGSRGRAPPPPPPSPPSQTGSVKPRSVLRGPAAQTRAPVRGSPKVQSMVSQMKAARQKTPEKKRLGGRLG